MLEQILVFASAARDAPSPWLIDRRKTLFLLIYYSVAAASAERGKLAVEQAVGLNVTIAKHGIWRLESQSTKSEGERLLR